MTTVADIISLALTDSGILGSGQTAQASDTANAFLRLQWMVAEWNRQRWLVYHLVDVNCATDGSASYALGTGLALNEPRLDRIDGAYLLDGAGGETPLRIIASREEWERLGVASLGRTPQYAFYDSDAASPAVYLWPLAPAGYTLHVLGKAQLQQFVATTDTLTFPPEYTEALYANLVCRLRAAYRLVPDEYFVKLAEQTLDVLKQANLQAAPSRREKVAGRSIGDLIMLALEDSGAFGEKPITAQDSLDALWRLNMTLAQWQRRRWLVYHLVETVCACASKTNYSVGPGGDLNIARPDRIQAAFIRQVSQGANFVDFPLRELRSREEYSRLGLKTLGGAPASVFFYDSGWPFGALYLWPSPSALWELHVLTKEVLQNFGSLATVVNLPPEYEMALHAQIAADARMAEGLPPSPAHEGRLKAALNTLRRANFQIGRLRLPAGLRSHGGYGAGNITGQGPGGANTITDNAPLQVLENESGEALTDENGNYITTT